MNLHLEELSANRVNELIHAFNLMDKDGDGAIGYQDLLGACHEVGVGLKESEAKAMLHEMDIDLNGKIDFEEFYLNFGKRLFNEDKQDEIKATFQLFDNNGDGYITKQELSQVLVGMGEELDDKELDELIREADLDGDTRISYDEFLKLMNS